MRVLHLSQSDLVGGAAIAAYRLHNGLRHLNIDTQMFVQIKSSDQATVQTFNSKAARAIARLRPGLDSLPRYVYHQRQSVPFSCDWLPSQVTAAVKQYRPDVLNLHWIGGGYLRIEALAQLSSPQVWTLHDMWAFTGGCHYSDGCDRYQKACGRCPQLNSATQWDLSRWIWQRKAKTYRCLPVVIVSPSHWLAECAKTSSLLEQLPIKVVPNGIDCQQYRPLDRNLARQLLQLPADKKLILFGAMTATGDRRKGFHLLQPALKTLHEAGLADAAELVVLGAAAPSEPMKLGLPVHYLGRLHDDIALVLAYCAADVFVAPSVQDNFPNTVLEAIACGLPCVAFNIGGMPDLIDHQVNGYLAEPFDVADLARGMAWVLADCDRRAKLSYQARYKAENSFSLQHQASHYKAVYEESLASWEDLKASCSI